MLCASASVDKDRDFARFVPTRGGDRWLNNIEVGPLSGDPATPQRKVLIVSGVEFIDENGGGPGVRLRKRSG